MTHIDVHALMASRTTEDYHRLALGGCVAIAEPAPWPGVERGSAEGVEDGFTRVTEHEPARAAGLGIRHHAWLCVTPAEADNRALSVEVLGRIPKYLDRPNVVGIGETGFERVTLNELETFRDHIELAVLYEQLLLVHTPQLETKYRGTRLALDTLEGDGRLGRHRVLIDHAEEHTIGMILASGFWAGITLGPESGVSAQRAIDMMERFGPERVCVDSGCDAAGSVPVAIAEFALAMRRRGHDDATIRRVVFDNPVEFLGQSPHFEVTGR